MALVVLAKIKKKQANVVKLIQQMGVAAMYQDTLHGWWSAAEVDCAGICYARVKWQVPDILSVAVH